jgi:hypothetical protein
LERTARQRTDDQPLWVAIRNRTRAIGFQHFEDFVEAVLCTRTKPLESPKYDSEKGEKKSGRAQAECPEPAYSIPDPTKIFSRVGAYDILKTAAEVFLMLNCGLKIDSFDADKEKSRLGETTDLANIKSRLSDYLAPRNGGSVRALPYLQRVLDAAFEGEKLIDSPFCIGVLKSNVDPCTAPCFLELIWSYWMEEGMLVQSINAVTIRFQNRRGAGDHDPLAHVEIDPLRPLSNLLWGYIQDDYNRLTVVRRAYEYDHHYGLALYGRAVPTLRSADRRSRFIDAFHRLLNSAAQFLRADDDTTVFADGFPVLQALKELHLILAQGAHNQYGDLPWTARVEMLVQQWLLARPEMRDFLQARAMVPYLEDWMPQVDTMKKLQGWTDTTITHFVELAIFGEQLLLSVRFGDWVDVNDAQQAANWARYWRPEIQSYIHAYRAATGADLAADTVDSTMPAALLKHRLQEQSARK